MPHGRLVVIGDVMTDVIVIPEGPLVRGSDRRARITSRPGGSGANQAVWLGAAGARVDFLARVGHADLAQLNAYFRARHVEPHLIADTERPSGVLVTIVDPDGERSFLTDRGANLALCHADLDEGLLSSAAGLVVSGYSLFAESPRAAVRWYAEAALQRKLAVSVDAASVGFLEELGTARFLEWTEGFSTLFANEDEALCLSGTRELGAQMQILGRTYPRVIVKQGDKGAAIGDRTGVRRQMPALAVEVIDSTGAGDAFAAGFLAAEQRGEDEAACLAAGIANGARAVTAVGGQPD